MVLLVFGQNWCLLLQAPRRKWTNRSGGEGDEDAIMRLTRIGWLQLKDWIEGSEETYMRVSVHIVP